MMPAPFLCCALIGQVAKYHTTTHSLSLQWDGGENWGKKSKIRVFK